jgi:RecA/RadA recombinase
MPREDSVAKKAKSLKDLILMGEKDGDVEVQIATEELPFDLKDAISTGLDCLDIVLGGGLYLSRTYELAAPESGGKSTLLDTMMASWQRAGGLVVRVEQESTWDKQRAAVIGVDLEKVLVIPAKNFQRASKLLVSTINKIRESFTDTPVLIIWDTITAAPSETSENYFDDPEAKEKDKWKGGQQEQPRMIREFLDQITPKLTHSKMTLMLVSQVYYDRSWGSEYSPTRGYVIKGGMGPAHYSSAILFMMRKDPIFDSDKVLKGYRVEINFEKNKQSPWCQPIVAVMYNETGFDNIETMWENVKERKLIEVTGNGWVKYSLNGRERSFRTTEAAEFLKKEPEDFEYIKYLWARFLVRKFPSLEVRFSDRMEGWRSKYGQ